MKKFVFLTLALIIALLLVMVPSVVAGNQDQPQGKPLIVSKMGIAEVQGRDVIVDVLVVVPLGQNANEAALEALRQQGARPFESAALGSEGFTTTGLFWDQLPGQPVVQNYNDNSEPSNLSGQGVDALIDTHSTWEISTCYFDLEFDEITDRYPSLVRESPGPQYFDGYNDVGWMRLPGNTLGVTWWGTTIDEADMALNTKFPWSIGGGYGYDVETVFLHENGHVVGLGHSTYVEAVMYSTYQGEQQILFSDDEEGVTYLYDSSVTGSVSGTITDGIDPIAGALVLLEDTSPLLYAYTDIYGKYNITGVPDPVTYTITTSASGFESSTMQRLKVNGSETNVDFALTATGAGPAPVIDNCNPNNAYPRERLTVVVTGANFKDGVTVDFGQKVTVQNVTFISANQLDVQIKVHPKAVPDPRDVTVTNPDGQSDTLEAGFTVNP